MILVSACLLNYPVRYKGDGNPCALLLQHADCGHFLPFCPETAGGLLIPRPAAEIRGGTGTDVWLGTAQVISSQGIDVSENFKLGAQRCADELRRQKITAAILKQRSPSCGTRMIYDGSFSGKRIAGMGVTAALLLQAGLPLYSEEEITEALLQKLLAADA